MRQVLDATLNQALNRLGEFHQMLLIAVGLLPSPGFEYKSIVQKSLRNYNEDASSMSSL